MLENIWNPWHGCRKYSEGCENCYMYYLDSERGRDGSEIYKVKTNFDLPVKKTRDGQYKIKSGSTVHVCMTSDFFLEEVDAWRNDAWNLIKSRPDLKFWLQTKRASRVKDCLPCDWGDGWENVSLCITAENQRCADERIPILLSLPFAEKNIMCAPMIGEITLDRYLKTGMIKKVLVDGENYEGTRCLYYEWVKKLYDECLENGVSFDFVGTGNRFIKDEREYRIPKAYQRVTALRSGLRIPKMSYNIPIQKKCRSCRRVNVCNGCRMCGKCGSEFSLSSRKEEKQP